ncbi:DUF4183 domain-containing protein [Bacillus sp. ISL-34]|nr:DUF4183 domain-containing protein [Bacillus sp. ISL-34]
MLQGLSHPETIKSSQELDKLLYKFQRNISNNHTGAAATAFPGSFAYYILYINAQIQTADTSTVTTTTITIPNGDTLDDATPIVVEFVVN